MSATSTSRKSTLAKALLYVALGGLILHLAHSVLGLGGSGLDWLLDRSLYYGLVVCAGAACFVMFTENRRLLAETLAEAIRATLDDRTQARGEAVPAMLG